MKYSIIVPVYNGEHTVEKLVDKIMSFFKDNSYTFEIVFIHDCGKDNSLAVLKKIVKNYPSIVKLIELNRNYGQHNAIISGFEYCSGDFIITIDEDLQHDPFDISLLIKEQKKGDYDVVYGCHDVLKHSGFRSITSRCLKKVLSISIPELHKDYSAYRLIKYSIAKETVNMRNSYTFLDGYLTWVTSHVSSTKVTHNERFAGESSYGFKKLLEHSLNIIFTFSNLPIRCMSYMSILVFILTLFYSVYIVFRKFLYDDFLTGYPTLIISLGIGISSVLLGLGIVGEYLFRVNLKTTNRPNYIVKKQN